MRLRTIVFATLFFVAALPGIGAVLLRVYENMLVRQTEAELMAQGAALSAAGAALWPEGTGGRSVRATRGDEGDPYGLGSPATGIDLRTAAILPERPHPTASPAAAQDAVAAAVRLSPIIAQTRAKTLASIILLDHDGHIAVGTGSYARLPEVATALTGQPLTVLRRNGAYRAVYRFEWLSRAAAIRVHLATPIVVNGRVVGVLLLSRSARALFKGLYEDRGTILFAVGTIFILLIILSGVLSRGVTRPIERLSLATRAVANGRGGVPEPPATAAIEIQGLYADFAAMAAAIEHRSRYLRDFAHAVSHEFKTPLAGIRGAIELLQDHPDMSVEDQRRFLANADAGAGRLALLVTRLLELAKADMATPGNETIDPLPAMTQAIDAWRSETLAIIYQGPPDIPLVAVPAATLDGIFATLFENSRQAGATAIRVDARIAPASLIIDVSDDGPGIASADRDRLFEPFFTTKRVEGGSGLGLAIARSLLASAGGTIELALTPATTFTITFPLAKIA